MLADGGATVLVVASGGAGAVCAGAGAVSVVLAGAVVPTAGTVTDGSVVDEAGVEAGVEGEPGDGLKLSKVELPELAGCVSLVVAGSGALEMVFDLRPRL